jgi:2-polyprenyl-3-methyl-5-hydroxy-6-metoxy-1,4-benzoquinol methylase
MRNLQDYQEQYEQLPFEPIQASYRRKKVLESLNKYRPRVLLEVGCGLDPLFNHFTEFDQMVVVEPGRVFAQNAAALAGKDPRIEVIEGTLEETAKDLSTWQFDFVVVSSLLHEVSNPSRLLGVVHELCGPSTVVHLNVPNAYSFHRLLAKAMGLIRDVYERSETQRTMQQPRIFDRDSLTDLVERSEFLILESGTFFIKPFTHAQMASMQVAGLMSDALLDGLYFLSADFPNHGSEIFMNIRVKRDVS